MDLKRNKKEVVKSRLKQTSAKIWGYQESETEGFDPVIDLMLGACAYEFERLSTEIYTSQSRILEKVAQILLPEVNLRPSPSYAVIHGKPLNPEKTTKKTDQFIFEKELPGKSSDKTEQKKLYFSPIPDFRLIDAEVILMATSHEIIRINDLILKETVVRSEIHKIPHTNKIWIGLNINPTVESLINVSFYFDWFNNPDTPDLLKLLKVSSWFADNKSVAVKNGFNNEIENKHNSETSDISSYLDINLKTEKRINQFFEDHFITITENILPGKRRFPEEFSDFFSSDDLDKLKDELYWIEIELPEIFPVDYLASTFCTPTAFPIINRRLHDSNRPYTLNKDLNIIPIFTDDYFYSIHNIASSNHINYQEVPFRRVSDFAPGTYSVRYEGVNRFDERDAYEYIQYLIELLREEHVAFKSLGSSLIEKELDELQIIINRLRLSISKSKDLQESTHFIIMKSELVEDIWLEFWSTAGAFSNNMPLGTACKNNDFDNKNLKLLTSTTGGKDPPDQVERISLFKNELLTRNRIVTSEDIRTTCFAELGNELKDVKITHRPIQASNRNTGFQNCIHIILTFRNDKSEIEKENLTSHIEKILQQKSSCLYKYRVEASV
jgi:hypothetical protein